MGAAFSLSDKFPWLFERKFFIKAYDYWYGYSKAQIELMMIDQPITVYPKDKKNSVNGGHTRRRCERLPRNGRKSTERLARFPTR